MMGIDYDNVTQPMINNVIQYGLQYPNWTWFWYNYDDAPSKAWTKPYISYRNSDDKCFAVDFKYQKNVEILRFGLAPWSSLSCRTQALLLGVAVALGGKALTIFAFLLIAYLIASLIITPYLRLFLRQKMRYTRRIRLTFSESLRSMRDIQLYSSHQFFVDRFMRDGTIAKRNDRLANLLPSVPKFLIEPAGITMLFMVGLAPALVSGDSDQLREAMPELASRLTGITTYVMPWDVLGPRLWEGFWGHIWAPIPRRVFGRLGGAVLEDSLGNSANL